VFENTARDYAERRHHEVSQPSLSARHRAEWEHTRALDRLEHRAAVVRARLGISPKPAILQP
jgi:hypothetical protein